MRYALQSQRQIGQPQITQHHFAKWCTPRVLSLRGQRLARLGQFPQILAEVADSELASDCFVASHAAKSSDTPTQKSSHLARLLLLSTNCDIEATPKMTWFTRCLSRHRDRADESEALATPQRSCSTRRRTLNTTDSGRSCRKDCGTSAMNLRSSMDSTTTLVPGAEYKSKRSAGQDQDLTARVYGARDWRKYS